MEIIKRSGLLIPKHDSEAYVKIKEELERRTRAYGTSNFIQNIFYLESEKFLLVPRNFPLQNYFYDYTIKDVRHTGQPIDITHSITPRNEIQVKAINHLMRNENCILQLSPGVGKTVISIYMIAERQVKTIIFVHKDALADQWRDRLLAFTNLKDEDIARLKSNTFEKDLQKPIIISTTQTFLSLLKRNRKEFLMAINDANIGVMVADEVHTSVGAPTFSECSIHIPAKYCYGLSATPYRYDGNGDIIEYHLGKIFTDADSSDTMDARVNVLLLDYEIDIPKRYKYLRWGGQFQRSRYLNMMLKSKPFIEVVRGLLMRFKDNRNLICMFERTKLIDQLYDWLPSNNKSKFYKSEKLDAMKSQVTFTTSGKCRDGIDAPWKDCLILTSPISNIEQVVGRVTRSHKEKQTPIVIDMIDYGCKDICRSFITRKRYYEKRGWQIQYIIVTSNKLAIINEEQAFEVLNQ